MPHAIRHLLRGSTDRDESNSRALAGAAPESRRELDHSRELERWGVRPVAQGVAPAVRTGAEFPVRSKGIERNHERFIHGEVSASRAVLGLM